MGLLALIGVKSFFLANDLTLKEENRKADQWPTLGDIRLATIDKSTQEFTDAFNDRYEFRDVFNYFRRFVKFKVFGADPEKNIVLGKDKYLFYGVDAEIRRRYLPRDVTVGEAKVLAETITKRFDTMHALHKRYYFMISPDKSSIVKEKLPVFYLDDQPSRFDLALAMLRPEVRANVIDLRPVLRTTPDAYYRTDAHWTPAGTQAVYAYLRDFLMQHENVNVPPLTLPPAKVAAATGGIAEQSGLARLFPEPIYHDTADGRFSAFGNCDFVVRKVSADGHLRLVSSECRGTSRTRIMICRDSFFAEMLSSIGSMFQTSLIAWSSAWNVKKMLDFKPDVVLDEIVERDAPNLGDDNVSN